MHIFEVFDSREWKGFFRSAMIPCLSVRCRRCTWPSRVWFKWFTHHYRLQRSMPQVMTAHRRNTKTTQHLFRVYVPVHIHAQCRLWILGCFLDLFMSSLLRSFFLGGTAESDHTLYLLGVIITQFRALRELMFDVLPNLA